MRRRLSHAAVLAWALWLLTLLGLAASSWLDHLLRRAGMPELTWFQAIGIPDVVAAVSAATVGAVLASRRPAHPVGWLLLGLGLSLAVAGVVYGYVRYGLVARPGALPAAGYLAGLSNGMILIWLSCVGFVLLLTPTGSLPSPRWRWWARVAAAAPVVWVLGSVIDPAPMRPEYPTIGNPLGVPALPGGLLSAATGAATTPPTRSRRSAPGSASRSTWTPSAPSCWPWSTRPCSRPGRRCGCGGPPKPSRAAVAGSTAPC